MKLCVCIYIYSESNHCNGVQNQDAMGLPCGNQTWHVKINYVHGVLMESFVNEGFSSKSCLSTGGYLCDTSAAR